MTDYNAALIKTLGFDAVAFSEKAIRGNWEPQPDFSIELPSQWIVCDDGSLALRGDGGKILGVHHIEKILLDKSAWEAVLRIIETEKELELGKPDESFITARAKEKMLSFANALWEEK